MAQGTFLVAEEGGVPVGCIYVEQRGDRGYFGLLAVDPAQHGKGVGRTLIRAAEDRFRRAGCRAVDISVVDLRTELPPFYRRLGYVESGTAPFSDPEKATRACHFILMSKPLTAEASRD
jgi:predicted N-acetyltransferase YhbS